MKKHLLATLIIIGFATPAFAAAEISPKVSTKYFAVKDTVGVCSVVDAKPSSNLQILGNKSGYSSEKDAAKALGSGCNDTIARG